MDPILGQALFAVVEAGFGWTVGGALGNSSDRQFCSLMRSFQDRMAGRWGLPENHDVARAVRKAQLQALERSLLDFEAHDRLPHLAPRSRQDFLKAAKSFCKTELGFRGSGLPPDNRTARALADGIGTVLSNPPHDGSAAARRDAVGGLLETAVLDELAGAIRPAAAPSDYLLHFRQGSPGEARYLDLYAGYVAEQLKTDARFRDIFLAEKLCRVEEIGLSMTEALDRIIAVHGPALARIESAVRETQLAVNRIEEENSRRSAEEAKLHGALERHLASLAEMEQRLQRHADENGIRASFVQQLLERVGKPKVPIPQLESALATVMDEFVTLRAEFAQPQRTSHLPGETQRAIHAALQGGDTREARAQLTRARKKLKHARSTAARLEARLTLDEARVAALELRYLDAIKLCRDAERLAGKDVAFKRLCREGQGIYHLSQFEVFGDVNALRIAWKVYQSYDEFRPGADLQWAKMQRMAAIANRFLSQLDPSSADLNDAAERLQAAEEVAKVANDRALQGMILLDVVPLEFERTQRFGVTDDALDRATNAVQEAIAIFDEMKDRALLARGLGELGMCRVLASSKEGSPEPLREYIELIDARLDATTGRWDASQRFELELMQAAVLLRMATLTGGVGAARRSEAILERLEAYSSGDASEVSTGEITGLRALCNAIIGALENDPTALMRACALEARAESLPISSRGLELLRQSLSHAGAWSARIIAYAKSLELADTHPELTALIQELADDISRLPAEILSHERKLLEQMTSRRQKDK